MVAVRAVGGGLGVQVDVAHAQRRREAKLRVAPQAGRLRDVARLVKARLELAAAPAAVERPLLAEQPPVQAGLERMAASRLYISAISRPHLGHISAVSPAQVDLVRMGALKMLIERAATSGDDHADIRALALATL